MDVIHMLSVAGYAWNFDCAQPPLVLGNRKRAIDSSPTPAQCSPAPSQAKNPHMPSRVYLPADIP